MLIVGFTTLYRVIKSRDAKIYLLIILGRFWVFRSDNHEYDLDGGPNWIRTSNQTIMSRLLYTVEL